MGPGGRFGDWVPRNHAKLSCTPELPAEGVLNTHGEGHARRGPAKVHSMLKRPHFFPLDVVFDSCFYFFPTPWQVFFAATPAKRHKEGKCCRGLRIPEHYGKELCQEWETKVIFPYGHPGAPRGRRKEDLFPLFHPRKPRSRARVLPGDVPGTGTAHLRGHLQQIQRAQRDFQKPLSWLGA